MEDYWQIIIYIIFAAIYALGRARKKKNNNRPPARRAPQGGQKPAGSRAGRAKVTFDDLLKEIADAETPIDPFASKPSSPPPVSQRRPSAPPPVMAPPPVPAPQRKRASEVADDELAMSTYLQSVKDADAAGFGNKDMFDPYQRDIFKGTNKKGKRRSKEAYRIAQKLQNPRDVKDAIILKEIFDRKWD